ncbi:Ubiquitin carboxyl-terminal hydrolase [Mycena indigotica]|uniref:Ubiquitin carboxyl-terminal hydrolase n=1 Tax=Mycena indigotica TaxID=2126181 RepID=A0A8H6TB41_9AGAR|nr:Ubiquitin carboxyl-terminal hydrolase [Mycena indigotica]KAF7315253.1 Ubiquitin carboxyl-terminal hydrolase [Mycena indigotica]
MAEDSSNGWQLTESDPGVFTELLKTLGVPLIVDDLYSLDSESLAALQPIHALIFLFKWIPTSGAPTSAQGEFDRDFAGFFAHQVVNNACATLAVMNALGNIPSLTTGPQLGELMSFTTGMDPQTRGIVLTSADWLREAHNSLSPPSAISLDGLGLPKTSEDAYHFVVYLPSMGALYELDGLKEFPVVHGSYDETGEGWLKKARETIEARIATYPAGALEFSLLALRDDPLPVLEAQLRQLQAANNHSAAAETVVKISTENSKRERWAFENSLRKHNHVGLVHALIVALAKAGKLESAKTSAKSTMKERIEARKAKGADLMDD